MPPDSPLIKSQVLTIILGQQSNDFDEAIIIGNFPGEYLFDTSVDLVVFPGQENIGLYKKIIFNKYSPTNDFSIRIAKFEFFISPEKITKFVWAMKADVIVRFELSIQVRGPYAISYVHNQMQQLHHNYWPYKIRRRIVVTSSHGSCVDFSVELEGKFFSSGGV